MADLCTAPSVTRRIARLFVSCLSAVIVASTVARAQTTSSDTPPATFKTLPGPCRRLEALASKDALWGPGAGPRPASRRDTARRGGRRPLRSHRVEPMAPPLRAREVSRPDERAG